MCYNKSGKAAEAQKVFLRSGVDGFDEFAISINTTGFIKHYGRNINGYVYDAASRVAIPWRFYV